jgi:hypothetical protein
MENGSPEDWSLNSVYMRQYAGDFRGKISPLLNGDAWKGVYFFSARRFVNGSAQHCVVAIPDFHPRVICGNKTF